MFRITSNKGFHITFENGYTISVQFGPGNYCENYDREISLYSEEECGKSGSIDAECAVFGKNQHLINVPLEGWDDTVKGYMKPKEVLELMNWVASQK